MNCKKNPASEGDVESSRNNQMRMTSNGPNKLSCLRNNYSTHVKNSHKLNVIQGIYQQQLGCRISLLIYTFFKHLKALNKIIFRYSVKKGSPSKYGKNWSRDYSYCSNMSEFKDESLEDSL